MRPDLGQRLHRICKRVLLRSSTALEVVELVFSCHALGRELVDVGVASAWFALPVSCFFAVHAARASTSQALVSFAVALSLTVRMDVEPLLQESGLGVASFLFGYSSL